MSDVLPPAPPSGGGGGCWKWGAISCGTGCAVLLLVTAVLVIVTWPRLQKAFHTAARASEQAAALQYQMRRITDALNRYHQKTGKYPAKLDALVPEYLAKADLRFGSGPDASGFTYYKPGPNAKGTDVVLEHTLVLEGMNGTRTEMLVRARLNSEISTELAVQPPAPEARPPVPRAGSPGK